MILFTLLAIPMLIALLAFLFGGRYITWKEFLAQIAIQFVVIGGASYAIYQANLSDVEVLGGRITDKKREQVHCRHSYQCYCVSVSCGKNCRTNICQTCYHHSYDVDWEVKSTVGNFDIDTIDWQGVQEPPRWTKVVIGEPAARLHSYTNYIKASPDSLFRKSGNLEKYKDSIPNYPSLVYDYHRIDRLVQIGTTYPVDATAWNKAIEEINADVGFAKQASVSVVLANKEEEFANAIEQKWLGGKKNDVIVAIGTDGYTISWVKVLAWTYSEMLKIQIRDDVLNLKTLDRVKVLSVIKDDVTNLYIRKPMDDFKYLTSSITPTTGEYLFVLILGIVLSVGLSYFMFTNDEYEEY